MDYTLFTQRAQTAAETGTAPPARALLHQCALLPHPPKHVRLLDIACGMGVVTAVLIEGLGGEIPSGGEGMEIVCGDKDETMVGLCRERIGERGWDGMGVQVRSVDAVATGFEDGCFTHALMNFGPQLMADPMAAFGELHRILQPSGILGFTCWTSPGWIQSVQEVLPSYQPPPYLSNAWGNASAINTNLATLGFVDATISTCKFETEEKDLGGYLELMKLLLGKVLVGESWDAYERLMRGKNERGEMGLRWECLVVSAVKPGERGSSG